MMKYIFSVVVFLCGITSLVVEAKEAQTAQPKLGNVNTISHIVHFINVDDRPLLDIEKAHICSWRKKHPNWRWKIWSKNDIDVLDERTKELFQKTTSSLVRQELLRFGVLYRYGGIFVDLNIECLKPFQKLVSSYDFFAGAAPNNAKQLKIALMGAKPAHPIVKSALTKVQQVAAGQFQDAQCNIENILTQSFEEEGGKGTKDSILASHYFYPVPADVQSKMIPLSQVRSKYLKPDCLAIQLCHLIPEIVVVVPSYNNGSANGNACLKNLESLKKQNWPYFSVIIIDDCSTDNNFELIDRFIKDNHLEGKFRVVRNAVRKGALENNYNTIVAIPDDKVVANPDGDDPLKTEWALTTVASAYADKSAWLTYGTYEVDIGFPGLCKPLPEEVSRKRAFRKVPWIFSQLRTFYAKLFHKIKKEDLLRNGKFYSIAQDLAYMFPMLEMASQGHIRYISDVIYIYNTQNPINDFRKNPQEQKQIDKEIRAKRIYAPIELW